MANKEHLAILKQGVKAWNRWKNRNWKLQVDLSGANLEGLNLTKINFSGADLRQIKLHAANLREADLRATDLSEADLSKADLRATDLNGAILRASDLTNAICWATLFANLDLAEVKGLDTVQHYGPSTLDIDTLYKSKGKIPEIFLRGCGVPETLIIYLPSLIGTAIDFYSCFISYSHTNQEFARRLYYRLQGEGIRCWLDEHQLKPGDPLHQTIYEGIRVYDKILLCCSETAMTSWWVEKEFTRGIKKEEDYDQHLIIPLNLDNYLFNPECTGWIQDEIKQRLIADFTGWKHHDSFERSFKGIVKALRTDSGKLPAPESKLKGKR